MSAKTREVAESAFDKYKRREAEIAVALREEHARHDAAIKNMHRLRLLRLQHEAQAPAPKSKAPPKSQTKPSPTRSSQTRARKTA
jgi:hypothetical protein